PNDLLINDDRCTQANDSRLIHLLLDDGVDLSLFPASTLAHCELSSQQETNQDGRRTLKQITFQIHAHLSSIRMGQFARGKGNNRSRATQVSIIVCFL